MSYLTFENKINLLYLIWKYLNQGRKYKFDDRHNYLKYLTPLKTTISYQI